VRAAARAAVGHLLQAPDLAEIRDGLAQQLMTEASSYEPLERAELALILDTWGIAPRDLLADSYPGVRAYAAVAGSLDGDTAALPEVRAALREPDAVNRWFDGHHPQRDGWFLDTLVEALLRRTITFDDVQGEAIAIAAAPDSYPRQSSIRILLPRA